MKATLAEELSQMFENDGTRWQLPDGRNLRQLAFRWGATRITDQGEQTVEYRFPDGSSIQVTMNGWHVQLPQPTAPTREE